MSPSNYVVIYIATRKQQNENSNAIIGYGTLDTSTQYAWSQHNNRGGPSATVTFLAGAAFTAIGLPGSAVLMRRSISTTAAPLPQPMRFPSVNKTDCRAIAVSARSLASIAQEI